MTTMNELNERSLRNLVGVHPDLVRLMEISIRECPICFTITEGLRTTERQKELFAQGRTKPGKIVTHADGVSKKSNHQAKEDGYGYAVDLYSSPNGAITNESMNDINALNAIAKHIKLTADSLGIPIVWGGDWKTPYDPPHFQIKI